MVTLRPANERGHANHGWLDSHHSFSFANYYDPAHMGFRSLRVINEDRVDPGAGFGSHPHRDMEIISYVVAGALEHKDSLGTGSVIRPGEIQRMTAGTGIVHSEFNGSQGEPVHFLQIWIEPSETGLEPGYEQVTLHLNTHPGELCLVASPDGGQRALRINQDVRLYAARLPAGGEVTHPLEPDRHAWLQLVAGGASLNGTLLRQGDGAAVSNARELVINATGDAEFLLFDLN